MSNEKVEQDTPRSENARILIVDDRPANRLALTATLQPLGQELISAGSGKEALAQVSANRFAVILMDV